MGLPLARSWCVCRVALALPFLLGPPCMETFLNKPCASSPTASPCVLLCRRGEWGDAGGHRARLTKHTKVHRAQQGG